MPCPCASCRPAHPLPHVWVLFRFIPALPVTEQISWRSPWLLLGSRLVEVVARTLKPGLGPCLWVVLAESRPFLPGTWELAGAVAPVTQPTLRAAGPGHVWGLGGQDLHEQPGKQVKVNTSDPASHIALHFLCPFQGPEPSSCRPSG